MLPIIFEGTNFLTPIKFIENKGSAQIKTSIIFSAINTPGITEIKSKKSRNHTELLLKNLLDIIPKLSTLHHRLSMDLCGG